MISTIYDNKLLSMFGLEVINPYSPFCIDETTVSVLEFDTTTLNGDFTIIQVGDEKTIIQDDYLILTTDGFKKVGELTKDDTLIWYYLKKVSLGEIMAMKMIKNFTLSKVTYKRKRGFNVNAPSLLIGGFFVK